MSSGEGDAATARDRLAQGRTLDAFTRCRAPSGCDVMVHLSAEEPVCKAHGGRDGIAEYLTSSDDGSFIYVRHIGSIGGDCE